MGLNKAFVPGYTVVHVSELRHVLQFIIFIFVPPMFGGPLKKSLPRTFAQKGMGLVLSAATARRRGLSRKRSAYKGL
eukprot:906401-Rhodomonas_salina.1